VDRPPQLYLFKEIFLVFFCNVILSRVIGPRLSLSITLPFIYYFFRNLNRHQQNTKLTVI